MVDAKEFLKAALQFHGHKCPAMPLGLRAGAAAMNRLGVERSADGQLLAILELGEDHCAHCFADGVQVVTGCTLGKGNVRVLGYGKFGLTLVDRATGRAVRVVPKAEAQAAMKKTPFFQEYRIKGVPPSRVPDEAVDPLVHQVLNARERQILSVGEEFAREAPKPDESFATIVCDHCGETVVESYARLVDDRRVCIPCQEAMTPAA